MIISIPYTEILSSRKKPLHLREILTSYRDIAQFLGVSEATVYRYNRWYPTFPGPVAFKFTVTYWARKYKVPLRPGPGPSHQRNWVVWLREQEGLSFAEIGRRRGITRQAAHAHWQRHVKRLEAEKRRTG